MLLHCNFHIFSIRSRNIILNYFNSSLKLPFFSSSSCLNLFFFLKPSVLRIFRSTSKSSRVKYIQLMKLSPSLPRNLTILFNKYLCTYVETMVFVLYLRLQISTTTSISYPLRTVEPILKLHACCLRLDL